MITLSSQARRNVIAGAVAIAALFTASSASAFTLGPTTPGKWGSPTFGTGAVVTYSYMSAGIATDNGLTVSLDSIMPAGYKTAMEAAFNAWSAVADITFVEVADGGEDFNASGTSGDIRIGAHNMGGPGGTLAHGFYPPVNGNTAAGDIHFDSTDTWKIGFGGTGFDIFQVMAHELGHAIGLDHSSVPNSLMNPFYTEAFSGLQADDIAGAQFIYGARVQEPPPGVPDSGATLALLGLGVAGLIGFRRRFAA